MEISFQTAELRTLCKSELKARRALGERAASALRACLSDIEVAEVGLEIIDVCEPADARANQRVIRLCDDGFRLILESATPSAIHADGAIDWSSVYKIKIVSIGQENE